jgi:hypothetical protein
MCVIDVLHFLALLLRCIGSATRGPWRAHAEVSIAITMENAAEILSLRRVRHGEK